MPALKCSDDAPTPRAPIPDMQIHLLKSKIHRARDRGDVNYEGSLGLTRI